MSKPDFEVFDKQIRQVYKYLFRRTTAKDPVRHSTKTKNFILNNRKKIQFLDFGIDIIFSKTNDSKIFKNRYLKYKQIMQSTFSFTYKVDLTSARTR